MADNNKLELVVEVDVNKANASIESIKLACPAWSRRRGRLRTVPLLASMD
jgi:hypothetical protein